VTEAERLQRDIGQILWLGYECVTPPSWLCEQIAQGLVGGVILFARNLPRKEGGLVDLQSLRASNEALHRLAPAGDGEGLIIAIDQEGGRVQRIREPATVWPPMGKLAEMNGGDALDLARQIGAAIGSELRALDIDLDFAPVLDVHTNPANPIIGDRAFASTVDRAASCALAFAAGLHKAGIIACGKHFPGHGDTSTDSHLELPRLDHALSRLEQVELEPFRRAALANLPTLMTAHVVFAALDDTVPATLSRKVITDLLRGKLEYRGVVISDDLDMRAIADHHGAAEAAARAILAGCDVLLLCRDADNQRVAREGLTRTAERSAELRQRIYLAAEAVRGLKRRHAARRAALASRGCGLEVVGCTAHRTLADTLARGGVLP
jgi:beta-N-acetylhexosaminidase